jgi:hypothetical protein
MPSGERDALKGEQAEKDSLGKVLEREYSNHQDQLSASRPPKKRVVEVETSLIQAFKKAIEYREVPFIRFGDLDAQELASAFVAYPIIIKPTLSCVNVAQRAISRDLGFDFDTYSTKITADQARILAGYVKPFLPEAIAVPALMELDRYFWTDKEMRARKGNWEISVTEAMNGASTVVFRKRMFACDGEEFEIDAAYPPKGETIQIAVDVKRIESKRDIHKRADEIINKATKFKKIFPHGRFLALVYYPFPTQHINAKSRLHSSYIEDVFFAGETSSSIQAAVELMLGRLGLRRPSQEVG